MPPPKNEDSSSHNLITSLASTAKKEREPLLATAGPSNYSQYGRSRRHSTTTLDSAFGGQQRGFSDNGQATIYYSSDEASFFDAIMEKVKGTKVAYYFDKLAVESEPGLTNAQLMLNNHDLKPGRIITTTKRNHI